MNLVELKAKAYDILAKREQLDRDLMEVNKKIVQESLRVQGDLLEDNAEAVRS